MTLNNSKMTKNEMKNKNETRLDAWPIPVADGWAGAEMRVFPLFDSCPLRQLKRPKVKHWLSPILP